jgi:hypothetical protein
MDWWSLQRENVNLDLEAKLLGCIAIGEVPEE